MLRRAPAPDASAWRALLAVPVAALVALALGEASREGYWGDELWTVRLVRQSPRELVRATAGDVHPPLYYLLVDAWVALVGLSPLSVRAPSVAFGAAALLGVFYLGATLYDRRTGLVAAALGALSVPLLVYAAEARMYGLLLAAGTLSLASLWRLLDGEWRSRVAAGYVLATAAMLYTHAFGAVFLAAQAATVCAFLAWRLRAGDTVAWRRWTTLGAGAGAVYAPWVLVALGWFREAAAGDHGNLLWIRRADATYAALFGWLSRPYPTLLVAALVALAAVRVGRSGLAAAEPRRALFLGGWAAGSVAAVAALSALVEPMFYYRFCLPLLAPVVVLAARGVTRLPRPLVAVVLSVLLLTGAAGAGHLLGTDGKARTDEALADVAARSDDGDAVVVRPWGEELYALYDGGDLPPRSPSLRAAAGADRVWVLVDEEPSLPGEFGELEGVTWREYAVEPPYRSYFDGAVTWWLAVANVSAGDAADVAPRPPAVATGDDHAPARE